MKYKQKDIPQTTTVHWTGLKPIDTRKKINNYYNEKLYGHNVINLDKNITISFSKTGQNKLAFGGKIYPKKAALVTVLNQIVRVAEFSNFGKPKEKDGNNVVGFLNFKCKVLINGITENIRFTVQLRNDGKFYYSHEVNIYKK